MPQYADQVQAGPAPPVVRGSNQSGLRAHNERLVLSLIRQSGALSAAEIARRTGLSAQTVSVIARALEADNLLRRDTPVRGKIGQPSVPLSLRQDGAYFLGLKVGRRNLELVLVDFAGCLVERLVQLHRFDDPEAVAAFARRGTAQLLGRLEPEFRERVAGLGIAMPFRLWEWAPALGLPPGALDFWRDRDIAAEVADAVNLPVYLENDASAACGAELVFGARDRPADFLYFSVGYFAGGGLVLDNSLVTGRTGNAAALGSLPVPQGSDDGAQLVDVASLSVLERMLKEAGHDGAALWLDAEGWDLPADTLELWLNRSSAALAYAIYSACCVIDVGAVIIDGWLPRSLCDTLVTRTRARQRQTNWRGIDLPDIRPGTIGANARALGAASLPLSDRFLLNRDGLQKGQAA